jgi:hypothetical protein
MSTKVFSFAICFMDIIVTAAIGIFFFSLFLSPILVHSPHFRNHYKKFGCELNVIVYGSFIVGVNFIRLIYCRICAKKATWTDLNEYYFFVKPLNNMANLNVIITAIQFVLCFSCLFIFITGSDEWVLGLIGMIINAILILFQFVRMFKTRRFIDDYLKIPTNQERAADRANRS